MKKFLVALLLLPSVIFAQNGFQIDGTAKGFPEASDVKLLYANDNSLAAAGKITNGKFLLQGTISEPGLYWLVLGNEQPQHLFVENSKFTVAVDKAKIKDLKVVGSRSHDDFVEFRNIFNPLVGELQAAAAQINRTPPGATWDGLKHNYDSINNLIQEEIDKYVSAKPNSYVSPFLLFITTQMSDDMVKQEKRYKLLSEEVRQSQIGTALGDLIADSKVGAVGTDAIDFTQPDINGQPVALSSFRGKYVLVDFWASWCKPCRDENPNIVSNYNKFRNKNFTVLGVSLDRPGQKDNWVKAIQDDQLTWTHVSDLQWWSNAAAQLYKVKGIPYNILVDPQGKIIAKNLRGPDLGVKLCEILGCN